MLKNKEDGNFLHARTLVITGIVLAAAGLRLAPHPMNFAPIGALALFGGAYFSSKREAFAIRLLSLILGDVVTGFHQLIPFVYASFLVSVTIGFWLRRKRSAPRIAAATLAGAIQFFLVTNLALWASSISSFPKTAGGLAACYVAGLPLFWNTPAGDPFYASLLFCAIALGERRVPVLREPPAARKG